MNGKPRRYAEDTRVPVDRSRTEFEQLLRKHKASQFGFFEDEEGTTIVFKLAERMVRQRVPQPQVSKNRLEAERRRRWRALLLITKAKLELVSSGDSTFEREFLADLMLSNGKTVMEEAGPQITEQYLKGVKTPLLLGRGA